MPARAPEEDVDAAAVVTDAEHLAREDELAAGAVGAEDVEHGEPFEVPERMPLRCRQR